MKYLKIPMNLKQTNSSLGKRTCQNTKIFSITSLPPIKQLATYTLILYLVIIKLLNFQALTKL